MSNGTLDPRSLREKAEALVTFTREGPLFIAWVQAVTDALEPASKPAKVECPNCLHEDTGHAWKVNGELRYSCAGWNKPAQPEPVAEEMPEAVSVNTWQLEELLKYADLAEVSLRTGFHPPEFLFEPADRSLRQCIDAIKEQRDQWRAHAAQPAPAVAMTEELEKVLNFAAIRHKDANTDTRILWDPEYLVAVGKAIAAVRSQAAEAGKVRMPKVRELLRSLVMECKLANSNPLSANVNPYILAPKLDAALAELDAVEGRK